MVDSAADARSKRRCSRNGNPWTVSARRSSRRRGGVKNLTPRREIPCSPRRVRKKRAQLGDGVTTATGSGAAIDASETRLNHGRSTSCRAAGNEKPLCSETEFSRGAAFERGIRNGSRFQDGATSVDFFSRNFRKSPSRWVTPILSRYSRNGIITRRELSSFSRNWLAVAGPFVEMKSETIARI